MPLQCLVCPIQRGRNTGIVYNVVVSTLIELVLSLSFLGVVYSLAALAYPVFAHIYADNNRPK